MSLFSKNTTCVSLRNPESPEIQAANASAFIRHVEFIRTATAVKSLRSLQSLWKQLDHVLCVL
jgi:hypothetical protein